MNLSVRLTTVQEDAAVAAMDGELDISTVALLDTVLSPLPGYGIRHLIVAAQQLRFCDVCGFRALDSIHATMAATGGGLAIAEPTPALRRLMELMTLTPMIPPDAPIRVYATVSQALRGEVGQPVSSLVTAGGPNTPPHQVTGHP